LDDGGDPAKVGVGVEMVPVDGKRGGGAPSLQEVGGDLADAGGGSRERLGWRRWAASSLHALPVVAQRAGTGWGPMENRNWNSPRWAGEKTS
jgi:hypothetical protein